jgi:hypothetical protein
MAQCITCGSELHPDRAKKYNYCMAPECQRKNLKGVELVAVGVNKAAEQYMLRDQQTMDGLASGKFADQRRGSFGTSLASDVPAARSGAAPVRPAQPASAQPASAQAASAQAALRRPARPRPAASAAPRKPWSRSQEKLALLYNEQGKRPEEIAQKLGLSSYLVTQIILSSKNRGKL